MEAVGPSWLMETMIMVSVRISSEPMGVSLPSSRMLVVLSGTSKVGTAVGTAVEGVGMPSSSSSGAEMVSTGLTWGRLVGVAVGTAVLVGVVVLAGVVVGVGLGPRRVGANGRWRCRWARRIAGYRRGCVVAFGNSNFNRSRQGG